MDQRMKSCPYQGCDADVVKRGMCEGHYRQSMRGVPLGPIRRRNRSDKERFDAFVRRGDGCWEWTGAIGTTGYGNFKLGKLGIIGAHRAALILTGVELPPGAFICHRCDNRACVRPDHLFIGTPADNNADMVAKGRVSTPWAKITPDQVVEIRRRYAAGELPRQIAPNYGVASTAISRAVHGRSWRHVP